MAVIAAKDNAARVQASAKVKVTAPLPISKHASQPAPKEKEKGKEKGKGKQPADVEGVAAKHPPAVSGSHTPPTPHQTQKRKGDQQEEAGGSKRVRAEEVVDITDSPHRHFSHSEPRPKQAEGSRLEHPPAGEVTSTGGVRETNKLYWHRSGFQ